MIVTNVRNVDRHTVCWTTSDGKDWWFFQQLRGKAKGLYLCAACGCLLGDAMQTHAQWHGNLDG